MDSLQDVIDSLNCKVKQFNEMIAEAKGNNTDILNWSNKKEIYIKYIAELESLAKPSNNG